MGAVLKLAEYLCQDAASTLKVLLAMALRGDLRGLMVCYRTMDGEEHMVLTGSYKSNPAKAAGASLKMSIRLMQANGELD